MNENGVREEELNVHIELVHRKVDGDVRVLVVFGTGIAEIRCVFASDVLIDMARELIQAALEASFENGSDSSDVEHCADSEKGEQL